MTMPNRLILLDFEMLQHSKEHGFYDAELDMYFDNDYDWLKFKYNKTWSEVM